MWQPTPPPLLLLLLPLLLPPPERTRSQGQEHQKKGVAQFAHHTIKQQHLTCFCYQQESIKQPSCLLIKQIGGFHSIDMSRDKRWCCLKQLHTYSIHLFMNAFNLWRRSSTADTLCATCSCWSLHQRNSKIRW